MACGDISWHPIHLCLRVKQSKTNQAGRDTIVLLPRTADASCPTTQGYDSGGISLLPVLPGHPSSILTDGHPLSSVECRRQLYRLLHHVGYTKSLCTTHTVFALGLQPPPLPALPPMKSSNLGIGEAKHINATSNLQASFNTAGLTGITELEHEHAWREQLPELPGFQPGGPLKAQMINIWSRSI